MDNNLQLIVQLGLLVAVGFYVYKLQQDILVIRKDMIRMKNLIELTRHDDSDYSEPDEPTHSVPAPVSTYPAAIQTR